MKNMCTQYTIFIIKKKNTPDYCKSAAMGFFLSYSRTEFEIAVINEPSVFEPLKFYCILDFLVFRNFIVKLVKLFNKRAKSLKFKGLANVIKL